MNFDFQAVMVLVLAISGLIWLVDAMKFAPRRRVALAKATEVAGGELDEPVLKLRGELVSPRQERSGGGLQSDQHLGSGSPGGAACPQELR